MKTLLALFFLAALLTASLGATTFYVTVAGLGGTPEYEAQFEKWSADLARELDKNGTAAQTQTLAGDKATLAALTETLTRLATVAKPEDSVAVFLIGHGTFDGTDYKFNLPGPDITASQLAALLNRIPASHQLIVNMTSCSGASIPALARKGRIVITATKSGTERNAPLFARFWIEGFHDPSADTDKNGTLSTLELYRYTARKTAAYFESEKLLATEHPTLTDTGIVAAARDPKPENGQGLLAARFPMTRPETEIGKEVAPGKQGLFSKKDDLEARIERLKYQKPGMAHELYMQQLTALLLDLARTQAEIDK